VQTLDQAARYGPGEGYVETGAVLVCERATTRSEQLRSQVSPYFAEDVVLIAPHELRDITYIVRSDRVVPLAHFLIGRWLL
jgi:hypothetical protein